MNVFPRVNVLQRRALDIICRCKSYEHAGGRISVPGSPAFHPRRPTDPDPEIVPAKLFRVERIERVKGTTRIQREILKHFGIDRLGKQVAVVKNIPENNNKLWKVKHLVAINPITFPYGEPTADDVSYCFLKENGECIVKKELAVPQERIDGFDNYYEDPKRLDGCTIMKNCRLKWVQGYTGGF